MEVLFVYMTETKNSKWKKKILFLGVIFLAFLFIVYFLLFLELREKKTEIKDNEQYNKILNEYDDLGNEISFFPDEIPQQCIEKEICRKEQFLQGKGFLYLKTKYLPQDYRKAVDSISTDDCKKIIVEDKQINEMIELSLPTFNGTYLSTYFKECFDLPESLGQWEYVIYVNEDLCPEDAWNHGAIGGIAMNEKENLIIYYYEKW